MESDNPPIKQVITADKTTSQVGEKITWTMTTTGGEAPLRYNFTVYNQNGAVEKFGVESANASIEYTPTAPGYYVAVGTVQDALNVSATKEGAIVRVDPASPPSIQAVLPRTRPPRRSARS